MYPGREGSVSRNGHGYAEEIKEAVEKLYLFEVPGGQCQSGVPREECQDFHRGKEYKRPEGTGRTTGDEKDRVKVETQGVGEGKVPFFWVGDKTLAEAVEGGGRCFSYILYGEEGDSAAVQAVRHPREKRETANEGKRARESKDSKYWMNRTGLGPERKSRGNFRRIGEGTDKNPLET